MDDPGSIQEFLPPPSPPPPPLRGNEIIQPKREEAENFFSSFRSKRRTAAPLLSESGSAYSCIPFRSLNLIQDHRPPNPHDSAAYPSHSSPEGIVVSSAASKKIGDYERSELSNSFVMLSKFGRQSKAGLLGSSDPANATNRVGLCIQLVSALPPASSSIAKSDQMSLERFFGRFLKSLKSSITSKFMKRYEFVVYLTLDSNNESKWHGSHPHPLLNF